MATAREPKQSVMNIFKYIHIFKYSNIFVTNIYSDIRSYQFVDTNVFGHSFVSSLIVRIYLDIRS